MRTNAVWTSTALGPLRSKLVLFSVVVVVGPFLYGYWMQQSVLIPNQVVERTDQLVIDENSLDFGERSPIESLSWPLALTNSTDRVLEILDFELGCLCTEVTPSEFTISPNETKRVTVILELQPRDDDELTKPVREFAASIKPIFKGGWPKQEEWRLTGRIINPYVIEPAYLNYGDSLIHGAPLPSRTITVVSRHPLASLRVDCQPPLAEVQVNRQLGTDSRFTVHFIPNQDLSIGRHEFTLRIQGVDADGSEMAQAGIRVFAEVVADVAVFPAVVHLGGLRLGENGKSDVVVRSRTGQPFEMVSVDTDPEASLQIHESQHMGGDYHYGLQCHAEELGVHVFKVQFQIVSDGESQRIPLTVVYSGIEAEDRQEISQETGMINVQRQKASPLVIN